MCAGQSVVTSQVSIHIC